MSLFATKPIDDLIGAAHAGHGLRRALGPLHLIALGIGAIIGTGIFVLSGQAAAANAGPGIVLSMVLAGVTSALAALCYAEFAAAVPVAGSAYTYAYATLGELVAWIIGWDLILESGVSVAAIAVGWGGYLQSLLDAVFSVHLPNAISQPPGKGGTVNLPAVALVLAMTAMLLRGAR
ncbi:MAG TPA: amino acid permease, partial [Kofleriaceae bacterium]